MIIPRAPFIFRAVTKNQPYTHPQKQIKGSTMSSSLDEARILWFKLIRRLFSKRKYLAFKYLRGSGFEIGALAHPLRVPPGVTVKYLDKISREEAIRMHPDQDSSKVVQVDSIVDGFSLASIPDATSDFLIANHVLEHTPNPILALVNWSRILRPGGILFISIPIAARSFDVGRSLTTPEHMLEDYDLFNRNAASLFEERSRQHAAEWLSISEPNIRMKRGSHYIRPDAERIQKLVAEANLSENNELHFHTFSYNSMRDLLKLFTSKIDPSIAIEEVVSNFTEVIAILKKKA
jgi:SAM-dependent methyltransferase